MVSIVYPYTIDTTVTVTVTDIVTDTVTDTVRDGIEPKKGTSFCKPTVEDIQAYCIERNNNVDAQNFYDFYESKGWLVGKNKMKDWKACVRTWERNSFSKSNVNSTTAQDYFDYAEELRRKGL